MLKCKHSHLLQEQVNWRCGVKNDETSKKKDFGEFSGDSRITPEMGTLAVHS